VTSDNVDAAPAELFRDVSWSAWQLCSIALLVAAFILSALSLQALALAAPPILEDWHLPVEALATPMSIGWFGAAIGTIVGGLLGDIWGRKWTVIAALALAGMATAAIALTTTSFELSAVRIIQGIGLGAFNPPAIAHITELVGARRKGPMIGIAMVCGPIGISLCSALAATLFAHGAWQVLFWISGASLLLVAIVMMLFMQESPHYEFRVNGRSARLERIVSRLGLEIEETSSHPAPAGAGVPVSALLSRHFLFQTVCVGACFLATFWLISTAMSWLPALFTYAGYATEVSAGSVPAWSVGGIAGALIAGWLSAWIGNARAGLLMAGACMVVLAISAMEVPTMVLMPCLFLGGLSVSAFLTVLYAYVAQVYPASIRSTALGIAETAGRLGAVGGSFAGAYVVGGDGVAAFFGSLAVLAGIALAVYWISARTPARASHVTGAPG